MKIAAVQMLSTPRVEDNLQQARAWVARAAAAGCELVALPEYFCLMGRRDEDKLTLAEAEGAGPIQTALADLAREQGVWLLGGTLPLTVADDPHHVMNTTLVYDPEGRQQARYDKIHLFRFDDGQRRYDESQVLRAGHQPVAFDAQARDGRRLRVGLSVCYDLRFPELYRRLMDPAAGGPCDLITVPAAFTDTTGRAHWELLLRARAVENQCYVMAPAQGGLHENGRRTWGHAMVVDPWGEVLDVVREEGPGLAMAVVDPTRLSTVRTQLPALQHRVLDAAGPPLAPELRGGE